MANYLAQLKASQSYLSLQAQPRLQWMLLALAWILLLSFVKSMSDAKQNQTESLSSAQSLHQRLVAVSNAEFSNEQVVALQTLSSDLLAQLPTANSSNVAEAKALAFLEDNLIQVAERQRYNLLGSENIMLGNKQAWSVRVEVNGRLPQDRLVELFELIDPARLDIRLASIQYSPKASNTFIAVIDLLYLKSEGDNE